MTKKAKIITLTLGSLAILGMGGAYAENLYQQQAEYKECLAREEIFLGKDRQNLSQKAPRSPEAFKLEANIREVEKVARERCRPKTATEIQKIVKDKKEGHEQYLLQLAETRKKEFEDRKNGLLEPQPLKPSELGVSSDFFENRYELDPHAYSTNTWTGYMDENDLYSLVSVSAGSVEANTLQGKISLVEVVGGKEKVSSGEYKRSAYLTPTATGPVRITAEKNGVLTLESLAVTRTDFDRGSQTSKEVSTPGGATYYFDLKTRTFR